MIVSARARDLGPYLSVVLFGASLWLLHHVLKGYRYDDVVHYLGALSGQRVLLSLALTAISYLVLTGYDVLALKHIHRPLPYRHVGLASFIGFAFSNTVGHSLLSGGSIRYRLYSVWGLTAAEVVQVAIHCIATFWLGCLLLFGLVFLLATPALPPGFPIPGLMLRVAAVLSLCLVGAYGWLGWFRKNPVVIRGFTFAFSSPGMTLRQIALAVCDLVLAGGALYLLLPDDGNLSFVHFLGVYLLAMMGGLASLVPGGIGVFDSLILLLLGPELPPSESRRSEAAPSPSAASRHLPCPACCRIR